MATVAISQENDNPNSLIGLRLPGDDAKLQYSFSQLGLRDQSSTPSSGTNESSGGGQAQPSTDATVESSIGRESANYSSSGDSGSLADNSLESSLLESYLQSQGITPSYGSKNDARTSQEGSCKTQICFDFTKGLCTRGDKCKYSHDLATIVHFNSKEKGICFDYLRNQCHRGLLCRFSHDLSNIAQQCQQPQVVNGAATKGRTNAICYDFVKGVCQRGNECRYSHDLSLIARTARGGANNPRSGEICYDYLRGRCNRGPSCKYSHNISFLAAPGFLPNNGGNGASSLSGGAAMDSGMLPTTARLTTSMSADPATLSAAMAAANSSGLASVLPQLSSVSAELPGAPLAATLSGELSDTMTGHTDQPPAAMWAAASAQAAAVAAANPMLTSIAQQRQIAAAAAAAAGINGYTQQLQQAVKAAAVAQLVPPSTTAEQLAKSMVQQQQQAAIAARAAAAMMQSQQVPPEAPTPNMYPNPAASQLMRSHSSPPNMMTTEAIGALLNNLRNENPALLAETLNGLAAAAAQANAQRLMSAGGVNPMMGSAPQPIPGRHDVGSAPSSYVEGYTLTTHNSMPGPEVLSRTAPMPHSLNPAALSPDLLPMLKEIWNK